LLYWAHIHTADAGARRNSTVESRRRRRCVLDIEHRCVHHPEVCDDELDFCLDFCALNQVSVFIGVYDKLAQQINANVCMWR